MVSKSKKQKLSKKFIQMHSYNRPNRVVNARARPLPKNYF